jgi:hypothetical protein
MIPPNITPFSGDRYLFFTANVIPRLSFQSNFSVINEEIAHGNSNEVTSSFTEIMGTPKLKKEEKKRREEEKKGEASCPAINVKAERIVTSLSTNDSGKSIRSRNNK